jgi:hypothetical protein
MDTLIDIFTARTLLREVVPLWEELLAEAEAAGGRLKFRTVLSGAISDYKVENYPQLYEDALAPGALVGQALLGEEGLLAFSQEASELTARERGELVAEIGEVFETFDPVFDAIALKEANPDEQDSPAGSTELVDPEQQAQAVKVFQALLMAALASFYEYLSVAVHGERLSSLVGKAKAGDDAAYGKAVQIDGRVLTAIPYFKQRYERAVTEDDERFREMVFRKQSEPPYRGRLTHKPLFMTFAFLESAGLLGAFTGETLLDFCNEVGIGEGIVDVKNLQKLLRRYRRFQTSGGASTP